MLTQPALHNIIQDRGQVFFIDEILVAIICGTLFKYIYLP